MARRPIRHRRSLGLLGAVAAGLALTAFADPVAATGAEPAAEETAWLFDPDAIVEIDLGGLSEAEIEALEADPDEYQPGSFELRVGGVPQGPPLGEVGIRLKGNAGSFRPLTEKAAFKLKFDEYVDDQVFFGLEKLTLNNMVQDPSMVHEALTYELFHALGLPASRTGYAFVRVNDQPYGLYLNLETLDEVSLPRWFESTAHLYEAGEPGVDLAPGGAGAFEVDEGDDEDLADLEALIAAANADGGDWSDGVAPLADLGQMAKQWAVERYAGHWDGYAGPTGPLTPNNYYLHSDAGGVFRMLPWGTDQTWIERLGFDQPGEGILFARCLEDASCAALYAGALEQVHAVLAGLELGRRAATRLALLAPYRAQEDPARVEETPAEIAASIEATCAFVAERPAELALWLQEAGQDPSAPPLEPSCRTPPAAQTDAPVPTAAVPDTPASASALRIGRPRLVGNSIVTGFGLPGPGRVRQLVSTRLGQRREVACAVQEDVEAAGFAELRCQLSPEARAALRDGHLPLLVRASFSPLGGAPEVRRRRLVARQRRP